MNVTSVEYTAPPPTPTPTYDRRTVFMTNLFDWGQCTYYVASRRPIPWSGNAGAWYSAAQAYGFRVGSSPARGAIMVSRESYLGHVAYVESVNSDGSWVVSEMHHPFLGVVTTRTVTFSDTPVVGFIF